MSTPIPYDELERRFNYHAPDADRITCHQHVREAAYRMAVSVCQVAPDSRERDIALLKIEEAMFWANSAVAREDR